MKIEGPNRDDESVPAPWLAVRRKIDASQLVEKILAQKPDASADEIATTLQQSGLSVNRNLIALKLLQARRNQLPPS